MNVQVYAYKYVNVMYNLVHVKEILILRADMQYFIPLNVFEYQRKIINAKIWKNLRKELNSMGRAEEKTWKLDKQ